MILSIKDKILLEEIQKDLPLLTNPFKEIALKLSISEKEIINKINYFISINFIREISAIFNSNKLGYKSTLVAIQVEKNKIKTISEKITSHHGVSHNYLRNNKHNIWFTLTIKKEKDFDKEVNNILLNENIKSYLILPAIKKFKTNVFFNFTNKKYNKYNYKKIIDPNFYALNDFYKKIINKLQDNNFISFNPWENITKSLNISESDLFGFIQKLKDFGILKRISAVIRHQKTGYKSNCMLCFNIPDDKIEKAGKIISSYPDVSHCYQRQYLSNWNYSLYSMIHKKSKKECESLIQEISNKIYCNDFQKLYSLKEFKKERIKYIL